MNIQLNGEKVTLPEEVDTIARLLRHLQVENRIVVVEWNKEVLEKEQHADTPLKDGDTVEIVHFVGGG